MTHTRRWLSAAAVLALGLGGALVSATPASAATFTVTSAADSGAGSLRDQIAAANGAAGLDTIDFQAGLADIVLTSGPIPITGGLIIDGPGASALSIVLNAAPGPIFTVNTGGDVTIQELDFIGNGNGSAVGISTVSDFVVTDCVFGGFTSPDEGGAISVLSAVDDVSIEGSTFAANSASLPGGAIYLGDVGGDVVVEDSVFDGNDTGSTGGAIFGNDLGALRITNTEFTGNAASLSGGAVAFNGIAGTGLIEGSLFDGNTAGTAGANETQGGAIYLAEVSSGQTFTIRTSEIVDNLLIPGTINPGGAGLFVDQIDGSLIVDSSTFALNAITSGVGASGLSIGVCDVNPTGLLRIINSTSDESSADPIHNIDLCTNSGGVELLYSTFVGPGILRIGTNGGPGGLVSSSIIDGNNGAINALAVDGAPILVEWSVLSMPSGVFGIDEGAGNQFSVTDPKLGPLVNNGGPTRTRLLLPGSPALDLGNPAVSGQPSFDQRGSGYPRVVGRIDIGAIEMPRTLPATGSTIPLPLLIGAIAFVVVGVAVVVIGRLRRRRPNA